MELKAKIESITNKGLITIKFSDPIMYYSEFADLIN